MTPDTPVTWSASRFLGLFGHLRRNEIQRGHVLSKRSGLATDVIWHRRK